MLLHVLVIGFFVACGDDTVVSDSGTVPLTDSGSSTGVPDDTGTTDSTPPLQDADNDGHTSDVDCDDQDASVYPEAPEACNQVDDDCDDTIDEEASDADTWYPDDDGDNYGRSDEGVSACTAPYGYAAYDGDCDDSDPRYHPGAPEDDCTLAHDYNCDGSVQYADVDGDLVPACEDCDDSDPFSFPDSPETCDGGDNDCDGAVDEDAIDASSWYGDADGDGAGGTTFTLDACEQPDGYVASSEDCDDLDASAFPGGTEVCDDADNDCNGSVDEGVGTTWYADSDHDGYGDPDDWQEACDEPLNHVANSEDCDDSDPSSHPGGLEVCDGADNDCDGSTDQDALDADSWYADDDGDGFGDAASETEACEAPSGSVAGDGDCDDGDAGVNPGASEICDGTDNDCDGDTDDDDGSLDLTTASTFYLDTDGDGHGGTSTVQACELPSGASTSSTDCDDVDGSVNPDATELCNDIDDDCDGKIDDDDSADLDPSSTDTWYGDGDGDGYGDAASSQEACEAPSGTVANSDDCDDESEAVNPGADELCGDEADNDCDGSTDEDTAVDASTWYADGDTDGYGDDSFSTLACEAPSGHVAEGGDCDDSDSSYSPGATLACDGTDRDCDGSVDGDSDGDGSPDGCPDGTECSAHSDCDSGYCGPTSATCVTLDSVVISALTIAYNGNMGGLAGADSLCAGEASSYGYSGTWVAFLSDATHDVRDLIPDTTGTSGSTIRDVWPVEDIYGTQLLADWNTLLGGTSGSTIVTAFDGDIIEEENGYNNDADGWHGSYNDGTYYSGQTCSDWTSTSGVGVGMELDASQFLGSLETDKSCSTDYAVLCVKVED